jgi:hypothetical protein
MAGESHGHRRRRRSHGNGKLERYTFARPELAVSLDPLYKHEAPAPLDGGKYTTVGAVPLHLFFCDKILDPL